LDEEQKAMDDYVFDASTPELPHFVPFSRIPEIAGDEIKLSILNQSIFFYCHSGCRNGVPDLHFPSPQWVF
jgi:hypothetical protein